MMTGFRTRLRWALLVAATTVAARGQIADPLHPRVGVHAAADGEPNSSWPNPSGVRRAEQKGGGQAGERRALAESRALARTYGVDDPDDAPPPTPPPSAFVYPAAFDEVFRQARATAAADFNINSTIPIVWANSLLLVSEFTVVAGTTVMFNWGLAEGHPRDLMLCPTVEAFQQCAVDQCQTLATVQETGYYLFHTDVIDGQPVTGAVAAALPSSTHADHFQRISSRDTRTLLWHACGDGKEWVGQQRGKSVDESGQLHGSGGELRMGNVRY